MVCHAERLSTGRGFSILLCNVEIPDQVRDDGACHAELDSASYCAMFKIPDQVRDDVFGVRDDGAARLFPLEHRNAFKGGVYGYGLTSLVGFAVVDVLPFS